MIATGSLRATWPLKMYPRSLHQRMLTKGSTNRCCLLTDWFWTQWAIHNFNCKSPNSKLWKNVKTVAIVLKRIVSSYIKLCKQITLIHIKNSEIYFGFLIHIIKVKEIATLNFFFNFNINLENMIVNIDTKNKKFQFCNVSL